MNKLVFSIYRYNPDVDTAPRMQDYVLDNPEGRDMMVLDALLKLKEQDPTLSFRRSCREGVCGSDGLNMNGKNGLACITPLSALGSGKGGKLVIRPLPGLPVVRDLVVDMSQFYTQYEKVKPYLINDDLPPAGEYLQTPEQREKLDGLYECILCACCSTSCPSFWWNPDKFIGPAGLLHAYRFLAERSGRCIQRFPLPRYHELCQRMSKRPESDQSNRSDQVYAVKPGAVSARLLSGI